MEHKIAVRQFTDDRGRPRRFHYFLLVGQAGTPPFFCESYGVRVREEDGGSAEVCDLTTDPTAMDRLMTLLVNGLVGPASLSDVVEDWAQLNSSAVRPDLSFAGASPAGR